MTLYLEGDMVWTEWRTIPNSNMKICLGMPVSELPKNWQRITVAKNNTSAEITDGRRID